MRKLFLVPAILLALALFSACEPLFQGVSEAVFIEFDQSLNFDQYQFQNTLPVPGGESIDKIITRVFDEGEEAMVGVWILYKICLIRNDSPRAKKFEYNINKFYVDFDDKRHYYKGLLPDTYVSQSNTPVGSGPNATVADAFRTETQTAPDQLSVPPNYLGTVTGGFVIFVYGKLKGIIELNKVNLPLRYDGTPVVMVDRGHDTKPSQLIASQGTLAGECRPFKKYVARSRNAAAGGRASCCSGGGNVIWSIAGRPLGAEPRHATGTVHPNGCLCRAAPGDGWMTAADAHSSRIGLAPLATRL